MSKYLNENGVKILWGKTKTKIAEAKNELKTEALSLDEINEVLNLFTLNIKGEEYEAVKGMTWREWVSSEYNKHTEYGSTGSGRTSFYVGLNGTTINEIVHDYLVTTYDGVAVHPDDTIVEGQSYNWSM